jgi:death-on-curing protein
LVFLRKREVLEIHKRLIEEFGGSGGLRDEGALESALLSVENRAFYENAGLAICAATDAYHLAQAHSFVDGNKRLAAAASEIFLELNGARLTATNDEIVAVFLSLAASQLTRDEVEEFFAQRVVTDP